MTVFDWLIIDWLIYLLFYFFIFLLVDVFLSPFFHYWHAGDRKTHADNLHRALSELEYSKEHEISLKQDVEVTWLTLVSETCHVIWPMSWIFKGPNCATMLRNRKHIYMSIYIQVSDISAPGLGFWHSQWLSPKDVNVRDILGNLSNGRDDL